MDSWYWPLTPGVFGWHTEDVRSVIGVSAGTCQCLCETAAVNWNVLQAATSWEKPERVKRLTDSWQTAHVLTTTSTNNCERERESVWDGVFEHSFVFPLTRWVNHKILTGHWNLVISIGCELVNSIYNNPVSLWANKASLGNVLYRKYLIKTRHLSCVSLLYTPGL